MKKAIIAISKDEPDMDCWIDYHKTLGFDILCYDDNDKSTLKDGEGFRVFKDWKWADKTMMQPEFYVGILRMYGGYYDWMLPLDCDEYVVYDGDLDEKLGGLMEFGGFCPNWLVFHSGGNEKRMSGRVFDNYLCRKVEPFSLVKTFINPKYFVNMLNPHAIVSTRPCVGASGEIMREGIEYRYYYENCFASKPTTDNVWINHYFTKSREDWVNKMGRGYKDGHEPRNWDDWDWAHESSIEDNRCSMLYKKIKGIL